MVEQELAAGAARCNLGEEREAFGGKLDMADLAGFFRRANHHRFAIAVKIGKCMRASSL